MIFNLQGEERLLLRFFKKYSRFEYALKVGGYGKTGKLKEVNADWPKYLKDIRAEFEKNADEKIIDAYNYLLGEPPKRLIIDSNELVWKSSEPEDKTTEALFKMIQRVRNNLFHGMKYHRKYDAGPPKDPKRNERLLQSCIDILDELKRLSPDKVQKAFEDAVVQL